MGEPSRYSNVLPTKRSSVLLIVSSYLPNLGGLQRVTSQLARELRRRGHRVQVVTQKHPRTLPASEVIDGVYIQRWYFITPRLRDLFRGRADLFVAALFLFPITLARLVCRIARDKPDAVNLHFVGAPALIVLFAHMLLHFRYIVSVHGDDVEGLTRGTRFDRWVFQRTLRDADRVTACSRYLLERALLVEPSIAAKAKVVYNGAELNERSPSPFREKIKISETMWSSKVKREVRLLAVGRMVPKKGMDVLLNAFAMLSQDKPYSRLLIIGDGPEHNSLKSLARDLGLHDKVEWRGAQNYANVMQAIHMSHLLIIPSREEPFGIVALEGMASGKPVVATRVGGLPEVLEGADAAIVCPENPTELAEAIKQTLERLESEPDYGKRNRDLATRFSLGRMIDEYEAAYAAHYQAEI